MLTLDVASTKASAYFPGSGSGMKGRFRRLRAKTRVPKNTRSRITETPSRARGVVTRSASLIDRLSHFNNISACFCAIDLHLETIEVKM